MQSNIEYSVPQTFLSANLNQAQTGMSVVRIAKVQIYVYNLLGKKVATLVNEEKQRGRYSVTFDASGITSGTV